MPPRLTSQHARRHKSRRTGQPEGAKRERSALHSLAFCVAPDVQLPADLPLRRVVLVMVLGRQLGALGVGNFLSTAWAPINAGHGGNVSDLIGFRPPLLVSTDFLEITIDVIRSHLIPPLSLPSLSTGISLIAIGVAEQRNQLSQDDCFCFRPNPEQSYLACFSPATPETR
jgi:hypothetical protein